MKMPLHWLAAFLFIVSTDSCKKEETPLVPTSSTAPIDGRWEYYSNNNGGCTNLIPVIMTISNAQGIIVSVPSTVFAFKTGDTLYKNITLKAGNVYKSDQSLSRFTGGAPKYVKTELTLKATGEMGIEYIDNDVCNPSQNWRKK